MDYAITSMKQVEAEHACKVARLVRVSKEAELLEINCGYT